MRFVEAAGARVSAIGLGTWQFGSREWGYGTDYAEKEAGAIVRRAVELGVTLIDTAEIYAFGRSERIVGEALHSDGTDLRDRVFLATKLFPILPLPAVAERRARASAQRLGTDTVDLYQLHWPNPLAPFRVQAAALRSVLDGGISRHVGVSNFTLGGWKSLESSLGSPILSNQVQFSLVARMPAQGMIQHAAENDRIVIAYSPLAQGFLSAKYSADNRPSGGVRRASSLFTPENLARSADLYDALRDVASSHDAKPAQIALAWVLAHPNVVAIPGASSLEQLEFNVAAAGIDLSQDEVGHLTKAAEAFHPQPRNPLARLAAGSS